MTWWEAHLARFLWRHRYVRPHSALGGRTPHAAYTEADRCKPTPPPRVNDFRGLSCPVIGITSDARAGTHE